VRWAQFCFGLDVVAEDVRRDLLKELREWELALLRGYRQFELGRKKNLITSLAFDRAPKWFGPIRRRVGMKKAETIARIGVEVLLGRLHATGAGEPALTIRYGEDDFRLVVEALAVAGPLTSFLESADLLKDVPTMLTIASEVGNLSAIQELIVSLDIEDLCVLRDEAQTIWRWFLAEWFKEAKQRPTTRLRLRWGKRSVVTTVRWDRAYLPRDLFYPWVVFRRSPAFADFSYELLNRPGVPPPEPPGIVRVVQSYQDRAQRARRRRKRG
jgi:hypothetical protein